MWSKIGPQHPEAQHVAVSHHGLRFIKRASNGDLVILETLPLEDIVSVGSSRAGVCNLQVSSGVRLPLHTNRAPQLAEMIGRYIRMVSNFTIFFLCLPSITKLRNEISIGSFSKCIVYSRNADYAWVNGEYCWSWTLRVGNKWEEWEGPISILNWFIRHQIYSLGNELLVLLRRASLT